jgi:hypothetical protein
MGWGVHSCGTVALMVFGQFSDICGPVGLMVLGQFSDNCGPHISENWPRTIRATVPLSYVENFICHQCLADRYKISVSQMTTDMFHLFLTLPGPFLIHGITGL